MLKKTFCLFLAFALALSIFCVPVLADETFSATITKFNGTRVTDALVIYTYKGTSTGTNTYGIEAVVEDGRVVSVGGNNNTVPDNGFVVSGHGINKDWIVENVTVGMSVTYDSWNMTVTFTRDSYTDTYATKIARDNALAAKARAIEGCYFYDSAADTRLSAADAKYEKIDTLSAAQLTALTAEYETIAYLYLERETAQYRGLWLRPTQKNRTEVENYVKKCKEAGINMICIEALYSGTLIYPPEAGSYFEQNPYFNGFDVMDAFVNLCHKYGIELHVWMPVFYSGSKDNNWLRSVAAKKPEWQLVTKSGSNVGSDDTSGLIFLNPANDEVQSFLIDTYEHLLQKYNVDGFQLDYIRYRDRTTASDFGYDSVSIEKFKKAYPRYANTEINYSTNAYYWNDWVNFRAEQVTNMVKRVRELIDEVAPNVVLSADVGASSSASYNNLYQDSLYWLDCGLLDMLHPMAYGEGYAPLMEEFITHAGDSCAVIPGLGAYIDTLSSSLLLEQAQQMVDVGCHGYVYFESSAFYSKGLDKLLGNTLVTAETVSPAFDNEDTIAAVLETLKKRIDKARNEGRISESIWNDIMWQVNMALEANETNANLAIVYLEGIETQANRIASQTLRDRIVFDASIALAAAHRDSSDPEDEMDKTPIEPEVPSVEAELQLIIDAINGEICGEDSTLIFNPTASASAIYNLVYTHCLLLKPVAGKRNCYEVVETYTGIGSNFTFKTALTSDMLIAAFHTDGLGSGVERVKLAKTVKVGTMLNVFGIDTGTQMFNSSIAMLYAGELNLVMGNGDVNNDGNIDQFDYILVKRHYFSTRTLTAEEKARADVNGDGVIDQFDYVLIKRHYFGTYTIGA